MSNLLLAHLDYEPRSMARHLQRLLLSSYHARCDYSPEASGLIAKLAETIKAQMGFVDVLAEPTGLATLLCVKLSLIKQRNPSHHGSLVPVHKGFRSEVFCRRSGNTLSMGERFTVAHEFGHTFFYYCNGGTPARIIPRTLDGTWSLAEENVCNNFARTLLART